MPDYFPQSELPELIFGLVAPIGVDLELVGDLLEGALSAKRYTCNTLRLTSLMTEIPIGLPLDGTQLIQSYRERIAYANTIRKNLGDDALAALAVSAIRSGRSSGISSRKTNKDNLEEKPVAGRAYIIRQLKRPEEISLLRRIYSRQFIQISCHSDFDIRLARIVEREINSRGGLTSDVTAENEARLLLAQDAKEESEVHGQNVSDAFPLGDIFINVSSKDSCKKMIDRFIDILFGNLQITPTIDEYRMYLAKASSLRSSDLSRQVGAAICNSNGDIISMGCNEVPKFGGGAYWEGDHGDSRDFVKGHDPNERIKAEILADVIDRMKRGGYLSEELNGMIDGQAVAKKLLEQTSEASVSKSRLMDLIEFGRIVHAEMHAITDAAKRGLSIKGSTLYCTTFPCHICAKHIISSGISRVVYIEPYPKSYAKALHSDAIDIDGSACTDKVEFEILIGISPYRYRDLFEKGKRKYAGGKARTWREDVQRPIIELLFPSYSQAETVVVSQLKKSIESMPKI